MATCKRIRIARNKLCRGDLRDTISIVSRTLGESLPGELTGTEVFTDVITGVQTAIKTIKGAAQFTGINIHPDATHLFYVIFSTLYLTLEVEENNHMINLYGELYKILRIENDNENDEFLVFQCTNRGDESLEAATA